jgi:hypothetical protein
MDVKMTEKYRNTTQRTALAKRILYRQFVKLPQFSTDILFFGLLKIISLETFMKLKLTLYVANIADCQNRQLRNTIRRY